jgi:hypothetical protein
VHVFCGARPLTPVASFFLSPLTLADAFFVALFALTVYSIVNQAAHWMS